MAAYREMAGMRCDLHVHSARSGPVDVQPFTRVADELHHQYLLGFTAENLDGKLHRLEVRVRDAHLTARARRSYIAAAK